MFRSTILLIALMSAGAAAAAPAPDRAVVPAGEMPPGVTVLDRHGDLLLVAGERDVLDGLGSPVMTGAIPAPPARTFTPSSSPLITELVAGIDGTDLIAEVEWLIGLGVRASQSPNLPVVADSLEARLGALGLVTEQHHFPMGTLSVPNVIATQTGLAAPDSVFVICAHFDATSEIARFDTPGADDNASGTIAVLTAARLLSACALDYTVKYVLFAGEEQGLVGSSHWVADMAAAGLPILGALNFDMIAWWTEGVPYDLEIETNNASRWLADAVCYAADTYSELPFQLHVNDQAWWGDFYPFWQHGFCAVNHEEAYDWYDPDFNPSYHSTQDTADKLSPDFFAGGVKTAVASLALLAGARAVSSVPDRPIPVATLSAGPNPFNGRVILRLEGAASDGVHDVAVFDLRGRKVAGLALTVESGRGEGAWEARDDGGRPVGAGIYLAVAEGLPGRPACRVSFVP